MNTQDAIKNLQSLINAALKGGIFSDTQAVFAVQASLDTLKKVVDAQTNGIEKEKREYAEGVYD